VEQIAGAPTHPQAQAATPPPAAAPAQPGTEPPAAEAPPTRPAPVPPATTPGPQPGTGEPPIAEPHVAAVPAPLWERLKNTPQYAPELLAIAAVETLGAQVDGYVRWLVGTYPNATADSIARYAIQRCARHAGYLALAGAVTRPWGALAEAAALTWAQARLVLVVAAAYGQSPTDPQRVPELLVLVRAHPDIPTAQAALDAARVAERGGEQPAPARGTGWWRLGGRLSLPLRGRRLPSRFFPGAGLLVGVVVNQASTEGLARRATARYRGRGADLPAGGGLRAQRFS
jgi:hypothetical protein